MAISITREENIPFVEDGKIMQMKKFGISITATQEKGQNIEDMEKELDETFNRNLEQLLKNDDTYNRLRNQLNYLASKIKEICPEKASKIITEAKKIN